MKRLLCLFVLSGILSACSTGYNRVASGPQDVDAFVAIAKQDKDKMKIPGKVKLGAPYSAKGKTYTPAYDPAYVDTGLASWYGPGFHGKRTANGEVYNNNDLTAAHPTLPLPSMVMVTNLENGRSLVVRVNDRGPFAKGRIIDLSKRAAELLGMKQQGVAKVRVELLDQESRYFWSQLGMSVPSSIMTAQRTPGGAGRTFAMASPPAAAHNARSPFTNPDGYNPDYAQKAAFAPPSDPAPSVAQRMHMPQFIRQAEAAESSAPRSGLYAQAGAFSDPVNAQRASLRIRSLGDSTVSPVNVNGQTLYRVRIGPLTETSAGQIQSRLVELGYNEAKLVRE